MSLIVHTANILGSFSDPFEFEGDYGPEMNPVRQKVFEQVVSKEALAKQLPHNDIALIFQAADQDCQHGPTLSELVTPKLMNELVKKQRALSCAKFNSSDIQNMVAFVEKFADQKIFRFFRNSPSEFLSLDKILRDKASRAGQSFDLPILSSTQPLAGQSSEELKENLLQALFVEEILSATKPDNQLKVALSEVKQNLLAQLLGENATCKDLELFCTPAGQLFFYWLYQSLNLHLVSEKPRLIEQINDVKRCFARTLGNAQVRADSFRAKIIAADSVVVFTQESDSFVPQALMKDGLFLPVDRQNPKDGTLVFLRGDLWNPDYQIIEMDCYEGYIKGRLNTILAIHKQTGEPFLLASAHGNSTRPEDGRLQISLITEAFERLRQQPEYANLQLLIGIDANTKTEQDVRALREHLDRLGLVGTSVGPTTIKKRMVTVQHSKTGRFAADEEDYLITLKPENGGHFVLTEPTVGFSEKTPDIRSALPNIDHPSDHYPIGATLKTIRR